MKIRKSSLVVAIMIIPWFTFAVGIKWPLLGIMINGCRVIGIVWAMLCLLKSRSTLHCFLNNGYTPLLVLFYGILLASTIINGENVTDALQLSMYGFWPFIVLSLVVGKDNYDDVFLEGIVIAFSVLIVINLILMITYPQGIYTTYTSGTITKYYLFGAKNQMVAPLMTALIFFVEYSYRNYNRLTILAAVLCSLCITEIVMGGSGTGILMVLLFCVICFYQTRKKKNISSTATLLGVLALNIGFVVLRLQNWFNIIIVSLLHKSLTLSDRVYVWDAAIEIIKAHPFIGTGVSGSLAGDVLLNLSYLSKNTFAHNMFLDYLVMGGFVTLGGFLMNLYVCKNQYDCSVVISEHGKSFMWGGVILYLTASIVEIYTGNYCLFMMMAYIASLPKYENKYIE